MDAATQNRALGEPSETYWGLWATVAWGVAVVAVWQFAQIATIVVAALPQVVALMSAGKSQRLDTDALVTAMFQGNPVFIGMIVGGAVGCGAIALVVKLKRGASLSSYLRIQPVSSRTLLIWFAVMTVFLFGSSTLFRLLDISVGSESTLDLYDRTQTPLLFWFAMIVVAPLFEEGLFRGFLFRAFDSGFLGIGATILVTSTLWAVMHIQYSWYGIGLIWVDGLLLGAARAVSGSLLVPLALHVANNFEFLMIVRVTHS
jgi:membrane protease YdiL (CAAX protease family)